MMRSSLGNTYNLYGKESTLLPYGVLHGLQAAFRTVIHDIESLRQPRLISLLNSFPF